VGLEDNGQGLRRLEAERATLSDALRACRSDLATSDAALQASQAELAATRATAEQRGSDLAAARQALGESERSVATLVAESQRLQTALDATTATLQTARADHEREVRAGGTERRALVQEVQVAEDAKKEAERRQREAEERALRLQAELEAALRRADSAERQVGDVSGRERELSEALHALREEHRRVVAELQHDLQASAALVERQNAALSDIRARADASEADRSVVQRTMVGMTVEVEQCRGALAGLLAELAAHAQALGLGLADGGGGGGGGGGGVGGLGDGGISETPESALTARPDGSLPRVASHVGRLGRWLAERARDHLRQATSAKQDVRAMEREVHEARSQLAAALEAREGLRDRAAQLVASEAKASELRGALAAAESQYNVAVSEVESLRAQVLQLQQELEHSASYVWKDGGVFFGGGRVLSGCECGVDESDGVRLRF
jgi:chromosome segregation ATPase